MRVRKVNAPRGGGFKSAMKPQEEEWGSNVPANLLKYRGPTHYCNWFVINTGLQGAYPGSMDDRIHRNQLSSILKAGITTFVCTQAEYDPNATEAEWRRCQKLRPYFQDAIDIVRSAKQSRSRGATFTQNPEDLQFVYFPIIDQDVAPDRDIIMLIHDLLARIDRGEKLYVHCWGGHGRAGTVCSMLMGLLHDLTPREALNRVQKYHDVRLEASQYRMQIDSPQRPSQRAQVRRVLLGWNTPVNVKGFKGFGHKDSKENEQLTNCVTPTKNGTDSEHTTPTAASLRSSEPTKIQPKRFDFSTPVHNSPHTPTNKNNGVPARARTPSHANQHKSKMLPSPANLKAKPLRPPSGGITNINIVNQSNTPTNAPPSPGSISLPPGYITPFTPAVQPTVATNVRVAFSPQAAGLKTNSPKNAGSPKNKFGSHVPSRGARW